MNTLALFFSPPSGSFREINCRSFHAGTGILPTPLQGYSTPIAKRSRPTSSTSPLKRPSSSVKSSDNLKNVIRSVKSVSIPIGKASCHSRISHSLNDCLQFSERWAGPTYSNSPPPSSLPIPKFSMKPKRSVSLDLQTSVPDIHFHPVALSAPASPTREWSPSPEDMFDQDDSHFATEALRRILNLDSTDD